MRISKYPNVTEFTIIGYCHFHNVLILQHLYKSLEEAKKERWKDEEKMEMSSVITHQVSFDQLHFISQLIFNNIVRKN